MVASDSPCAVTHVFESAGSYAVRARARDGIDKASPWSDSMLVAITYQDRTNPTVAVIYPTSGSAVGVGLVTVKAVATDNIRVTKVEFFDGATTIGEDASANSDTFDVNWIATSGTHTLRAVARDSAGNTGQHAVSVKVGGPTYHSGVIDTNEAWYAVGNPHILLDDVWTGRQVTLTIMPGCEVQFSAGVELYTGREDYGALIAVGKADSTITFTSLSDTVAGFWKCIGFYGYTSSTAHMSYCNVLFGGQGDGNVGAVKVDNCNVKFDHNLVRKSGSNGVWLRPEYYSGDFTNNTITGCTKYAIHVAAMYVAMLGAGNVLAGNTMNGIEVDGGPIVADGTWLNHDVPYVISSYLGFSGNAALTIAPGCSLKFNNDGGIGCDGGSLVAVGKPDSLITFTALTDTTPGFWASLSFSYQASPTTRLSYCIIEYAGGGSASCAVEVSSVVVKMDHCTLRRNRGYGVWCLNDGYSTHGHFEDFSNNTITTSGEYPVRIEAEETRSLGAGNVFIGNAKDGILVDGGDVKTTGTWPNHGVPYVVNGDVQVGNDTTSPVITIAAGTSVKLTPQTEFIVGSVGRGGLIADGTAGQIEFTSSVNPPTAGDWRSISFEGLSLDSQCRLVNCKVEYGGYGSSTGNIFIRSCTPLVTGCSVGHSDCYGMYLAWPPYPAPDTLRANNAFYDNRVGDIYHP